MAAFYNEKEARSRKLTNFMLSILAICCILVIPNVLSKLLLGGSIGYLKKLGSNIDYSVFVLNGLHIKH